MYVHSVNATINTILHEEVKKERLLYASVIVKIPVGGIFGYIASYLFCCFNRFVLLAMTLSMVTSFTACSSDDDSDIPVYSLKDVDGNYSGTMLTESTPVSPQANAVKEVTMLSVIANKTKRLKQQTFFIFVKVFILFKYLDY